MKITVPLALRLPASLLRAGALSVAIPYMGVLRSGGARDYDAP